jgi:hypothetical protein
MGGRTARQGQVDVSSQRVAAKRVLSLENRPDPAGVNGYLVTMPLVTMIWTTTLRMEMTSGLVSVNQ